MHSLLATRRMKSLVSARLGEDRRNAIYRISYNAFATASLLALVRYVRRLPDRSLYRVPWPWRVLTAAAQLALVVVAVRAAVEVGVGPFSGVPELAEYVLRKKAPHEPEAQGPSMGVAGLRTGGPFRYVRHPLNASVSGIVLLTPEMSVVRLTVAAMTVLYAVVGSLLEEQRLLVQYGDAYERYRRSGVPFFLPCFPHRQQSGCKFCEVSRDPIVRWALEKSTFVPQV